jgi:hypothetical protein
LQDIHAEAAKKRRRTTKKPYSRSIVGATLEVIQKKRAEKPEVRDAAREAALRYVLFSATFQSHLFVCYFLMVQSYIFAFVSLISIKDLCHLVLYLVLIFLELEYKILCEMAKIH